MTTPTTEEGLVAHESGNPLNVEPGYYNAHTVAVDDTVGDFGPQWRFSITFDDYPDEEPSWAWAAAKLGTKAKLTEWAAALLGRPLAIGERLMREQLVGLPCRVSVEEKKSLSTGLTVNFIAKILPRKPAANSRSPTQAEPALDDKCFCGKPVFSYAANGTAFCEKHAKEAAE